MKILELDNLGLVSPEKIILEEISLSVEAGAHLTITEPSGSGKSSLLKLLAALVSLVLGGLSIRGGVWKTWT